MAAKCLWPKLWHKHWCRSQSWKHNVVSPVRQRGDFIFSNKERERGRHREIEEERERHTLKTNCQPPLILFTFHTTETNPKSNSGGLSKKPWEGQRDKNYATGCLGGLNRNSTMTASIPRWWLRDNNIVNPQTEFLLFLIILLKFEEMTKKLQIIAALVPWPTAVQYFLDAENTLRVCKDLYVQSVPIFPLLHVFLFRSLDAETSASG